MRTPRGSAILALARTMVFVVGGATVAACSAASTSATPTPTPIVAIEQTPQASGSAPPASGGTCLERASQVKLVGQPCITGSYDHAQDITVKPSSHETTHTVAPFRADFSLWAVAPGNLQGTAHLSYEVTSTYKETLPNRCTLKINIVAPFTWDVQLVGQYTMSPDGSVQVMVQATPERGPDFIYHATKDCPEPDQQGPGIPFPLPIWTLTGGVYDARTELPLDAVTTGTQVITTHIEETDGR
jgi:hypothetical protein